MSHVPCMTYVRIRMCQPQTSAITYYRAVATAPMQSAGAFDRTRRRLFTHSPSHIHARIQFAENLQAAYTFGHAQNYASHDLGARARTLLIRFRCACAERRRRTPASIWLNGNCDTCVYASVCECVLRAHSAHRYSAVDGRIVVGISLTFGVAC